MRDRDFFRKWRSSMGSREIALAHTRNDRVETFLLNLLRGAGIGRIGFHGRGFRQRPIRPLIEMSRERGRSVSSRNGIRRGGRMHPIWTWHTGAKPIAACRHSRTGCAIQSESRRNPHTNRRNPGRRGCLDADTGTRNGWIRTEQRRRRIRNAGESLAVALRLPWFGGCCGQPCRQSRFRSAGCVL